MKIEPYQLIAIILVIGIGLILFTSVPAITEALGDLFGGIFKSPYEYEFIGDAAEKIEIDEGICLVTANSTLINRGLPIKDVIVSVELSDLGGKRIDHREIFVGDLEKLDTADIFANFTTNCDNIGGVAIDVLSYDIE